jgi:hypothetical protein
MILYTKDLLWNISAWKIVSGQRWDMLTESRRNIITHNGGWVLVEKID